MIRILEVIGDLDLHGRTLGVVTPFSAHARAITTALGDRFGSEWFAEHDVGVSTAHRFQGGERDVMVFSTVVTPGMPTNTARWLEYDRNLINVAVSRAKILLIVVGHPEAPIEHSLATLVSLWTAASSQPVDPAPPGTLHSEPEKRLWSALEEAGLACTPKALVEGYELDFAWAAPTGAHINVEVDGDHHFDGHGRRVRQDQTRDAVLTSLGWHVIRVPAWYAFSHPRAAVEGINSLALPPTDPGFVVHIPL